MAEIQVVTNEWAPDFGDEIKKFFKDKFDAGAQPDEFLSAAANVLADFSVQFYDKEFAKALAEVVILRASVK